jgi:hypothetical protein
MLRKRCRPAGPLYGCAACQVLIPEGSFELNAACGCACRQLDDAVQQEDYSKAQQLKQQADVSGCQQLRGWTHQQAKGD